MVDWKCRFIESKNFFCIYFQDIRSARSGRPFSNAVLRLSGQKGFDVEGRANKFRDYLLHMNLVSTKLHLCVIFRKIVFFHQTLTALSNPKHCK